MSIIRRITGYLTSRLFLTIVFLVISAVIAFGVMPALYSNQSAVRQMPRVKEPIKAGERIGDQQIELVDVGSYNLPSTALVYKEDIIDKYARAALVPGDFLFQEKLSDHQVNSTLDKVQSEGQRLLTITPKSSAAALSSHLLPGDVIGIATIQEVRNTIGTVTEIAYPDDLARLTVYAVESSQGNELKSSEEDVQLASSSASQQGDLIPKTITLIVTDTQAQMLLQAEYGGGIHVIFKERMP